MRKKKPIEVERVKGSYFPIDTIKLSLQAFLDGGFGLRGTSRMIKMTGSFLQNAVEGVVTAGKNLLIKTPSYNTVKNWVLQLGC